MNKENIQALLEKKKQHTQQTIDQMKERQIFKNDKELSSELSSYDNHPADSATDLFVTEHSWGIKSMLEKKAIELEEAQIRLQEERYGICETCGKQIGEERLVVLPETKTCIVCAKESDQQIKDMKESFKNRPQEEGALDTRVGTKTIGDPLLQNEGMEYLDELMRFGSAQSPQEVGNYKNIKEFMNDRYNEG